MTSQPESTGLDPSFFFNPFDPAFITDPYPTYKTLREKAPVYEWPFGNCFLLSKYSDIATALRDPRLSTNPARWEMTPPSPPLQDYPDLQRIMGQGIFIQSGPTHARLRRLVGPTFTAKSIQNLRPAIEELAEEAIQEQAGQPTIDIAALANFIPLRAISRVLGIPRDLEADFRRFGAAVLEMFDPLRSPDEVARLTPIVASGLPLVRGIIAERRKALGDDLLSSLIRAEEAGDRLGEEELLALVAGLVIGGGETTVYFIDFGVLTLLRHPEALAAVRADPALLREAVDEILRFDSFIKMGIARYALEDVEIRGVRIAKGKMIIPLTGSAGRDPERYADADVFNIRRGEFEHLTFGAGPHYCLGAPLARLEAEVTLSAILRRYPSIELASEPVFGPHPYLRKIASLAVNVGGRGGGAS